MQPLTSVASSTFRQVRFVLTDMDETLTFNGRLPAATYTAIERLQCNGVCVIPVTAAPAGWCDQMARMWPVDGVVAENGGLFLRRAADGHAIERTYWHPDSDVVRVQGELQSIAASVRKILPGVELADDQPFRLTSIAFKRTGAAHTDEQLAEALRRAGAHTSINNLWVLGWLGEYDKLAMSRRMLRERHGVDIDASRDEILYSGDSTNDAPMFAFFRHTVGVSTVTEYLQSLPVAPAWVTRGPGGAGFVEIADAVLASRERIPDC